VPLGVVVRRDQLHDLAGVAGNAEIARDGHEHVRTVSGDGEHFLVDGESGGQVFQLQFITRLFEPGQDADSGEGKHPGGCRRRNFRRRLCSWSRRDHGRWAGGFRRTGRIE